MQDEDPQGEEEAEGEAEAEGDTVMADETAWRFRGGVCFTVEDERWHITIAINDEHMILEPGFATEKEALAAYERLRPELLKTVSRGATKVVKNG